MLENLKMRRVDIKMEPPKEILESVDHLIKSFEEDGLNISSITFTHHTYADVFGKKDIEPLSLIDITAFPSALEELLTRAEVITVPHVEHAMDATHRVTR